MRRNTSPPPRAIAAALLDDILRKAQPMEQAVTRQSDFAALPARDRAHIQLLLKTALRRLGQIDALLSAWITTPLPPDATLVTHVLRLGLAQLLWLDTPPHAAIHTAVEMVKHSRYTRFSGMVNAVLQRAQREGAAMVKAQDEALINIPGWLRQSWLEAYGESETRAIGQLLLGEPPLDLTVKSNAERWAQELGGILLPNQSIRLTRPGPLTELPGFAEGEWWVQDAAAALPVQLLGDINGQAVIDLCAAPGGKTAQLAALGARVTAVDINAKRMKLVTENLARLHLAAECIVSDAAAFRPASSPDAILLDAPCSATGTLRRHPDVAWHRTPEDIARLAQTQKRLLLHALSLLPPGGKLVYAVCSLEPQEGERQVEWLLAERKDVTLLPSTPPAIQSMATQTPHGWRTAPSHLADKGGLDGFFMSLLQKI